LKSGWFTTFRGKNCPNCGKKTERIEITLGVYAKRGKSDLGNEKGTSLHEGKLQRKRKKVPGGGSK